MQYATNDGAMLFFVLAHVLSFLLDLVATIRLSDREKDLEILLLRQQVRILQRKRAYAPRISCWEKCALAILAAKLTLCWLLRPSAGG
jgi:hypothetical protein